MFYNFLPLYVFQWTNAAAGYVSTSGGKISSKCRR